MKRLIPGLALLALLLAGCAPAETQPVETTTPPATEVPATEAPEIRPPETEAPETTAPPDPVDLMMAEMTLEEKVGQLFIVTPEALAGSEETVTEVTWDVELGLTDYPVGGVILFAGNIISPEQVTELNEGLQEASELPLFLAVDEEGGIVARLANNDAFDLPKYRSAAAVGASGERSDALEMGYTIGGYLRQYGFNLDFAPVADVNTNPDNPVIGTRAFSSDPETAALLADAMAMGLRQQGIIPVFKHFPGHGDTAEDSHEGIAVSYKTEEEMLECEWLPFLEAGWGDCVMVGHIAAPELTGDLTPATMSAEIVTGILREKLGFGGLIVADSLSMGAITENYTSGEAALNALKAGCDILLMPEDLGEAYAAVLAAVEDGRISLERLDGSVRRILEYKIDAGILNVE